MSKDFDFLHGDWDVANRQLTKHLVGSEDWREFPARSSCRAFFDGSGNVDEITFPTLGSSGCTISSYEPKANRWSVYWISSRDGLMSPPISGGFSDGVGTFYGDDVTSDGEPVRCRFLWSRITPTSARWEQAYSGDGEQTWETNWIMDFTRR